MEILAFLKPAPNFSFRQGKSYETNVVEEYCWAITVATERLCCSRLGSSVLEQPGFHLYALVCTYVVEHTYIYICSTNYDPDYIYIISTLAEFDLWRTFRHATIPQIGKPVKLNLSLSSS
jgi:hypothetical protein